MNKDTSPSSPDFDRLHAAKRSYSDDSGEDSDGGDSRHQLHSTKRMKDQHKLSNKGAAAEPPKKISFGLSQKPNGGSKISFGGFKMGMQKPAAKIQPTNISGNSPSVKTVPAKPKVAAAFGDDEDDEEEEEMPPEAKMRMKNIGRETPTSAGPNSFGKFRMGFCDAKKMFERQLKEAQEDSGDGKKS